ncbi:hypothetical protein [Moorena sp. SIO3B2]|uniref:hypothetical protein n=1 Tax=Moorena sp. SIO3B2 TaxID=2607827 RepID=UPI0013C5EF8D|nr:hypothetical protein [Moorena sp. SIO3B2]NEP35762.1 hypothetical protein [Moorena sp. SIO3B2]
MKEGKGIIAKRRAHELKLSQGKKLERPGKILLSKKVIRDGKGNLNGSDISKLPDFKKNLLSKVPDFGIEDVKKEYSDQINYKDKDVLNYVTKEDVELFLSKNDNADLNGFLEDEVILLLKGYSKEFINNIKTEEGWEEVIRELTKLHKQESEDKKQWLREDISRLNEMIIEILDSGKTDFVEKYTKLEDFIQGRIDLSRSQGYYDLSELWIEKLQLLSSIHRKTNFEYLKINHVRVEDKTIDNKIEKAREFYRKLDTTIKNSAWMDNDRKNMLRYLISKAMHSNKYTFFSESKEIVKFINQQKLSSGLDIRTSTKGWANLANQIQDAANTKFLKGDEIEANEYRESVYYTDQLKNATDNLKQYLEQPGDPSKKAKIRGVVQDVGKFLGGKAEKNIAGKIITKINQIVDDKSFKESSKYSTSGLSIIGDMANIGLMLEKIVQSGRITPQNIENLASDSTSISAGVSSIIKEAGKHGAENAGEAATGLVPAVGGVSAVMRGHDFVTQVNLMGKTEEIADPWVRDIILERQQRRATRDLLWSVGGALGLIGGILAAVGTGGAAVPLLAAAGTAINTAMIKEKVVSKSFNKSKLGRVKVAESIVQVLMDKSVDREEKKKILRSLGITDKDKILDNLNDATSITLYQQIYEKLKTWR